MWGEFTAPAGGWRGRERYCRFSLVALLAAAGVVACGKERAFVKGTTPLQPDIEAPADAGTEPQSSCSGSCVGCQTAGDCASPEAPLCDAATQTCVRCLADADCPSPTPICKLADGERELNRCVECTTDAGCPADRPACDPSTNQCTARCTSSTQCSLPTPICNEATQRCVGCLTSSDCAGNTDECDAATSRCVQCLDDTGCTGGRVCNLDTHLCVECLDNSQCIDPLEAHCELDASAAEERFTCVGCVEDRDCVGKPGVGGLCRPNEGRCVECLSDSECADDPATSNCSTDGVCSACTLDADCTLIAGRPACAPNVGCVECVDAGDCAGSPGAPVCKVSNVGQTVGDAAINTCVECTANTDCSTAGASRCENNQCVACSTNADCSHIDSIPGTALGTALNVCDAGLCVECTGQQSAACGTSVCNSMTRACSNVPAGSAEFCEPCLSDAHCSLDGSSFCSRDLFGTVDLGFFCFPAARTNDDEPCRQTPYSEVTRTTTSDGQETVLCLLNRTTCAGMADAIRTPCSVSADCGSPNLDDGQCVTGICSLPCSTEQDCFDPTVGSCLGGACQL